MSIKKVFILFHFLILLASCKKSIENAEKPVMEKHKNEKLEVEKNDFRNSKSKNFDYDKVLNDYEKYVYQYIHLYKKAIGGNYEASTEYPKMMEKITEIEQSLINLEKHNVLNSKQVERLLETQKMMLKQTQKY